MLPVSLIGAIELAVSDTSLPLYARKYPLASFSSREDEACATSADSTDNISIIGHDTSYSSPVRIGHGQKKVALERHGLTEPYHSFSPRSRQVELMKPTEAARKIGRCRTRFSGAGCSGSAGFGNTPRLSHVHAVLYSCVDASSAWMLCAGVEYSFGAGTLAVLQCS